jgi:hypothetical protein
LDLDDLDEFTKNEKRAAMGMTEMPDDDLKASKGDNAAIRRIMEDIAGPSDEEERKKREEQYEENIKALNMMRMPVIGVAPQLGGGPAYVDGQALDGPVIAKRAPLYDPNTESRTEAQKVQDGSMDLSSRDKWRNGSVFSEMRYAHVHAYPPLPLSAADRESSVAS